MSRFYHAFQLAIGCPPIAIDRLRALHAQLKARTPELAEGDPWRLGLLAAEREYLAGQILALDHAEDPTEHMDMSIGWLLLATHAPDEDPRGPTLAACRLADRIAERFERAPPRGVSHATVLEAVDAWRSWTGIARAESASDCVLSIQDRDLAA